MATYVTVAEADAYFEDRLFAEAWENADPTTKDKAIKMATKLIDRQPLKGRVVDVGQPLAFPRAFIGNRTVSRQQYIDVDTGWYYEDTVPQRVKDACCEQAMFLLSMTAFERARQRQQVFGIVDEGFGDANEAIHEDVVLQTRKRTLLCPEARELMLPYLIGSVGIV
jgi:hypothetical protein